MCAWMKNNTSYVFNYIKNKIYVFFICFLYTYYIYSNFMLKYVFFIFENIDHIDNINVSNYITMHLLYICDI